MSYEIFKILHLAGVFMVLAALGGLIFRGLLNVEEKSLKKLGGLTTAVGLILILISGLSLLVKLRIGFQGWVIVKMAIWIAFGGLIAAVNRKPECGKILFAVSLALGIAAAFFGITKPF